MPAPLGKIKSLCGRLWDCIVRKAQKREHTPAMWPVFQFSQPAVQLGRAQTFAQSRSGPPKQEST